MLYIAIILFALWNGYVIRWKLKNEHSQTWHSIGWWVRLVVVAMMLSFYFDVGFIADPALLLDTWYGVGVTSLTSLVCGYWVYNLIINKINGWDWDYLGKGKKGGFGYSFGLGVVFVVDVTILVVGIVS